jgi:L-aminopeptidase/D-esterase-like protein
MTGLDGLQVGHATDIAAKTGVTVVLADEPAVAAVRVSGGAPATRETDLLASANSVERVDAIVLSGGSAFGLSAADGAMRWLAAHGRGFAVGETRVPIVPAASLFDLSNGGDKARLRLGGDVSLYPALGFAACEAAAGAPQAGSVGAGMGALTADLKGGSGAAETTLADGSKVLALVAANPVGRVTLGSTAHFRAAPFEIGAEFGGLGLPRPLPADAAAVVTKRAPQPRESTTSAVVATDCTLTRPQAEGLAIAAHDGIALAVFPAHTPFDGDTVFALSTARRPLPADGLLTLCAAAATTLARAIAMAVQSASPQPGDRLPTWRERYGMG